MHPIAYIAMAEGGTKRCLEEMCLPIERHPTLRFISENLLLCSKTFLSLPLKLDNLRKRQKDERSKMDEVLLSSQWVLVNDVPHYELKFLSGRTKTCLA